MIFFNTCEKYKSIIKSELPIALAPAAVVVNTAAVAVDSAVVVVVAGSAEEGADTAVADRANRPAVVGMHSLRMDSDSHRTC